MHYSKIEILYDGNPKGREKVFPISTWGKICTSLNDGKIGQKMTQKSSQVKCPLREQRKIGLCERSHSVEIRMG